MGDRRRAIQWNAVRSEAGVLRGVQVHVRHEDYLTLPYGRASVGLRDLRQDSPTEGLSAMVELSGDEPASLVIPRGLAHGFYFREPSLHIYAVTEYWDPDDKPAGRPEVVGEGLLDENRHPVLEGALHDLGMRRRWRRDHDSLDLREVIHALDHVRAAPLECGSPALR
jgi:hypothetical protein